MTFDKWREQVRCAKFTVMNVASRESFQERKRKRERDGDDYDDGGR